MKYNDKLDQLTWLHSVEIHIMPFTIRLEEDFFDIAFELYHRLLKLSENKPDYYKEIKKSKIPLINILFMAIDKKHRKTKSLHKAQSNRSYDWEWFVIPESKSLYINEITLPAIDFNFTLNRKNLALDDFSLIKTIAEIFGTTFTNVNDAPIQMKGLKVRYIFDSKKGVLDRFLFHYRENLISTILKIIGSINIIGNPIGLARYIGSGFVDLIEKPIEGIQRGPLGLGIGIYEGSSSF